MKWLKYYRERVRFSQKTLAENVGVQENTVWRWENGRAVPSAEGRWRPRGQLRSDWEQDRAEQRGAYILYQYVERQEATLRRVGEGVCFGAFLAL